MEDCHMCGKECKKTVATSMGGMVIGIDCGCHDEYMNGPRHEDMAQNLDGFPDGWTAIMLDGMEYLD